MPQLTPDLITDRTYVSARPNVISTELSGEAILLDLDAGIYFGLNSVGTDVWEMLSTRISVREIHERLLTIYTVDADRCRKELVQLLERMAEEGLISIGDEAHV